MATLIAISALTVAISGAVLSSDSVFHWLGIVPIAIVMLVGYRVVELEYAGRKADRRRLAGLQSASVLLSTRGDGDEIVAALLTEVCRSFEAEVAELLIVQPEGVLIHRVVKANAHSYMKTFDSAGERSLRARLAKSGMTARLMPNEPPYGAALIADGWRNCLVAPLPSENMISGALVVFNQWGNDTTDDGELVIADALAREIANSFEKGKLFAAIVEERYKLSRIVDTTYDGVLTLASDGVVRSWNRGWEQITGIPAGEAIGQALHEILPFMDNDGRVRTLRNWSSTFEPLPDEVHVVDRQGSEHWLQCSYRAEVDQQDGASMLIVVAHDKTDEREIEQLREDVDRLAELEATQRARVLEIQESLQPTVPAVPKAEFGVFYQPSDTSAPTGGDFYDWQVLPGGDIHIAVVDVLGSGIEATNDAFAVIHTLRTLAYQGIPVDQLIVEADNLLATLNPDLVATVVCIRYNASVGRARIAGGGHPPTLILRANGDVDEIDAPGIPVGWPGAGSEGAIDVVLEPSDALVLYTDGIVEAHRDIVQGLADLRRTAAQLRDYPVRELARVLVERSLEGAARRDDSLALVVRHCGDSVSVDPQTFSFRSSPSAEQVPVVRHKFTQWLDTQDDCEMLRDDLAMIVSELATNAARLTDSFFEVRARVVVGGVTVEVEDDGPGFDSGEIHATRPDNDDESGRGLLIVRTIADDMTVRRTSQGCIVKATKLAPLTVGDTKWRTEPATAK